MKVRCSYCGSYISDTDEKCPNCGATNEKLKRVGNGVPKTIDELKTWYVEHNLPSEEITRFFIGKNIEDPRAFGIYFDGINYIVYKNKDNGQRAIRYEGKDEQYAVNELYQKLKEEIQNQKNGNYRRKKGSSSFPNSKLFIVHFISVFIAAFTLMWINPFAVLVLFLSLNPGVFIMLPIFALIKDNNKRIIVDKLWHILSFALFFIVLLFPGIKGVVLHRNDSYYVNKNNNALYYNFGNEWYHYDNDYWTLYSGETDGFDNIGDNYTDYNATDFKNSDHYSDTSFWSSMKSIDTDFFSGGGSGSGSDWDSGSNWSSSDSWDSGSTDWGSDW